MRETKGENFISGMELSRRFYEAYGKELLSAFSDYAGEMTIGIAGAGSECLGFDDALSRDHDFAPGFSIWLSDEVYDKVGFRLYRAYEKLPKEFLGVRREASSYLAGSRRGVMKTSDFYLKTIGFPGAPKDLLVWLHIPSYALAEATNGVIFYAGGSGSLRKEAEGGQTEAPNLREGLQTDGVPTETGGQTEFMQIRKILQKGYPEDVRKKLLARHAALSAQSGQYNYLRALRHGEEAAAQMALYEFAQHAMAMVYLLNNAYMPYYKWMFRGARQLIKYQEIAGAVEILLLNRIGQDVILEQIEAISGMLIEALKEQGLSNSESDYLEHHAFSLMEHIRDGALRNMHVMA